MPPKARPDCKIDDCGQPRYVFPNGDQAVYCRDHLNLRNTKRRNGLERMTGQMKAILQYLREQRDGDVYLFVELHYPLAHGKTLDKLLEDDRIFRSASAIDGAVKYRITGRGLKDLAVYEPKRNRKDGCCPSCGERPRRQYSSGRMAPYCEECDKALSRRKTARLRKRVPKSPCSRCHKRARYQYPGGKFSAYCEHCARVVRRRNARKQRREVFKAVMAGAPVPNCKTCKVRPCVVFPHCIAEQCDECRKDTARRHRMKVKQQRLEHGSAGFRPDRRLADGGGR